MQGIFLNAEGAKVTQRTQKKAVKNFLFFCALCESFASSAFKVPVFVFIPLTAHQPVGTNKC
jgi:hypothetical protein